jgi:hypothetical protein
VAVKETSIGQECLDGQDRVDQLEGRVDGQDQKWVGHSRGRVDHDQIGWVDQQHNQLECQDDRVDSQDREDSQGREDGQCSSRVDS